MTSGTTQTKESEEGARPTQPTVFVSDPSAEAERIAQALRGTGYAVVDVPMSMLLARVAVQPPRVILVDADAEGALDAVARLRELPHAQSIDVVFLGRTGAALQGAEDALAHEGSGFFTRPVDIPALVRKVEALTGGVPEAPPARASTPPPSLPSPSKQTSAPGTLLAPSNAGAPGLPPVSMRAPELGLGSGSSRPPSRPPPPSPAAEPTSNAGSLDPASAPGATAGRVSLSPETAPQTSAPMSRGESRRAISIQTPLSTELEALLAEAEQRVGVQMTQETALPTPEEEIEAVLPAEILSSLDEPIEEDEDEDFDPSGRGAPDRPITGSGPVTSAGREDLKTHGGMHTASTTGLGLHASSVDTNPREAAGFAPVSGGASGAPSTGAGSTGAGPLSPASVPQWGSQGPATDFGSAPSAAYPFMPPQAGVASAAPPVGAFMSTLGSSALQPDGGGLSAIVAPGLPNQVPEPAVNRSTKAESVPPPVVAPRVFGPGEAPSVLARAISARATGALCFESQEGVRRAVLREGDVVTASSGVDNESLLAFLGSRGDLPRERVQELVGKVPPFGRHAGAALVAHGHLRQDQLWPVLRAHAEWVLGRALLPTRGTAVLEGDPPGRLRNEPSVFGGSTGAEVLVEVVRRVIAPEEAIERLGGPRSRIGDGDHGGLLSECALDGAERDLLTRMRGSTVGELLEAAPSPDFASVLYALSLLGVVDVIRSVGARPSPPETDDAAVLALDEDAIRDRVRARLDLVEEGDYFAVLGLAQDATGYEVRRAFLDLRRTFEPSRILSPELADLADDVRKIVSVLDEAYEILRDNARRERYRRAITGAPA